MADQKPQADDGGGLVGALASWGGGVWSYAASSVSRCENWTTFLKDGILLVKALQLGADCILGLHVGHTNSQSS